MWRPRLPGAGNPDFWPLAIVVVIGPTLLAITEGQPVIPTLLVAGAAIAVWYLIANRR
jgi:hypothetical protein